MKSSIVLRVVSIAFMGIGVLVLHPYNVPFIPLTGAALAFGVSYYLWTTA